MLSVMFLVLLVAIVTAVALVLFRGGRKSRVEQAACGRCGYFVRGIESLTCPECGADLREVGIVTPHAQRGMGVAGWLVLWTVGLPLPAAIVTGIVYEVLLPYERTQRIRQSFSRPPSNQYRQIEVRSHGRELRWPWQARRGQDPPLTRIDLRVTGLNGSVIDVTIDPTAMTYERTSGQGAAAAAKPVDVSAATAWFKAAGADAALPEVVQEATELANQLKALPTSPNHRISLGGFMGSGSGSSSSGGHYRGAEVFILPFWLLVWLGGCVLIWRKHRRQASAS